MKTSVIRAVVLKLEPALEFSGGFVKTDGWAPPPESLIWLVWGGAQEFAYVTSFPRDSDAEGLENPPREPPNQSTDQEGEEV